MRPARRTPRSRDSRTPPMPRRRGSTARRWRRAGPALDRVPSGDTTCMEPHRRSSSRSPRYGSDSRDPIGIETIRPRRSSRRTTFRKNVHTPQSASQNSRVRSAIACSNAAPFQKDSAGRSEREPHQGDRERQEGLVLPEEPRRLDGGPEEGDRVLLLPHGPVAVRVHDRPEDLVQRDARLEGLAQRHFRGRGLVLEARRQRAHHGLPLHRGGRAEPQELGVAESGDEGAVRLPEQMEVLRGLEERGRPPDRVGEDEGVTEEPGVGRRRDEEGTDRVVRSAGGKEGPELVLHHVERPRLHGLREPERRWGDRIPIERGNVDRTGPLHRFREEESQVRNWKQSPGETESLGRLEERHREREVVAELAQVVQRVAEDRMGRGGDPAVQGDAGEDGPRHADVPRRERGMECGDGIGEGGEAAGLDPDVLRGQAPLPQAERVQRDEPEERDTRGKPADREHRPRRVRRLEAVGRVEARVALVRVRHHDGVEDEVAQSRVLRDLVEEACARFSQEVYRRTGTSPEADTKEMIERNLEIARSVFGKQSLETLATIYLYSSVGFAELRSALGPISFTFLRGKLRQLEKAGFVH